MPSESGKRPAPFDGVFVAAPLVKRDRGNWDSYCLYASWIADHCVEQAFHHKGVYVFFSIDDAVAFKLAFGGTMSEKLLQDDAHNECHSCKHRWYDLPGQRAVHYGGCPNCGNLYWTWLNADEWVKKK